MILNVSLDFNNLRICSLLVLGAHMGVSPDHINSIIMSLISEICEGIVARPEDARSCSELDAGASGNTPAKPSEWNLVRVETPENAIFILHWIRELHFLVPTSTLSFAIPMA